LIFTEKLLQWNECDTILIYIKLIVKSFQNLSTHGKNSFVEISKNLVRYRFENNFIGPSIIM